MCIPAILIEEIASEGAGALIVPPAISDKVPLIGPIGQVVRGARSARRITKSDNPIVWIVEGAVLGLNVTGNLTASKALRVTAACATWAAFCLAPEPLLGTVALALTNDLLEEQANAYGD